MRIRLDSIGCRLNAGEIDALARKLASAGHAVVGQGEPADLCVLNTCAVTAVASRKSRHLIRQLRRSLPDVAVVVTGCLAELEANAVAALGADLVVGNEDKDRLVELLTRHGLLNARSLTEPTPPSPSGRTRAFLKVQDGCDNACAFCVVTIARGCGRSVESAQVISELQNLQHLGYREVVLSGVHLGSYGHDFGRRRGLKDLIHHILAETDLERLRLSSLEPWDLDAEFFTVFDDPRVLPHLHLPLQSGCDATLRRMARKTTVGRFAALVDAARNRIDNVSISTDIMVGFPGETDAEFEASAAAVEDLAFSRLHVFRYSRREGTRAATMPNPVPGDVARERSRRLHDIGQRLMAEYHGRFIGRRKEVLWENAEDRGGSRRWSGLTGNYIRVTADVDPAVDLENEITQIDLVACVPGGMVGKVVGGVGTLPIVGSTGR